MLVGAGSLVMAKMEATERRGDPLVRLTYSLTLDLLLVKLQMVTLQRIKHMVGYKGSDMKSLEELGYNLVLADFQHYGPGDVRTV
jgi:hypothetical protein